jgi:UDP-N-acetylmuramoyl-tripeptide--D-alanyl-D-alanine ligase
VHVEFFAGPEQVAKEKGKILRHLGVDDFAILNFDDATVYDLHDKTRGKVLTYGFGEGAMIRAANYQIMFQKDDAGRDIPLGVSFKIDHDGHTVPMRLHGSFGHSQVYAALAAAATGIAYGMNLVEISEALSRHVSPPGRLKLIEGVKRSWLLDDTYNSSPAALHAALETLHDIPAKRRIAVLGDMLELGKYTIEAHKDIGRRVKTLGIDALFVVGPRSKFIAQEARELGMPRDKIFEFSDSREAAPVLKDLIEEGDVVLLKGSQSMRIERVALEVMAHPESAESLLIRQDKFWKGR